MRKPSSLLVLIQLALGPTLVVAQQASPPAWAAAVDSAMSAELARASIPGAQIAVVAGGKLAWTKGYGVADAETRRPVTENTLFRVGSVTKMVSAAVVAQLAAEGTLDLQAPISRYVTEITGRRVGTVTTHQLLSHSSGWLDNAVAYGRMGEGALGEVFTEVTDTLFMTEPGRVYSYSNPAFSMAGYVAERAGKARFGDLADRLVLRKMGMPRATFRPLLAVTHDFSQGHMVPPTGPATVVRPMTENTAQWAAGFLFTSAAELARFTMAMMNGGMLDGERVLSADAVRLMTTGYVDVPASRGSRYGYGLVVDTAGGRRVWQHGGAINGFNAQVVMWPEHQLAVLILVNRGGAAPQGVVDLVARLAAGITPPPPPAAPPTPRDPTATERAALVGTYRNGAVTVELVVVNDSLQLRQGGGGGAPVRMSGSDRLVVLAPGQPPRPVFIVRDSTGRAAYLHTGGRALARRP